MPLLPPEQKALRQFAAAVRRELTSLGMNQERLAELTQLPLRTVQKIEAGDINVLINTVQRIQKALGRALPLWGRLVT